MHWKNCIKKKLNVNFIIFNLKLYLCNLLKLHHQYNNKIFNMQIFMMINN